MLNVDLPETPMSYTHRVGRTARAGARGTALSLVSIGGRKELFRAISEHPEGAPPRKIAALRAGGACCVVTLLDIGEDDAGAGAPHREPSSVTIVDAAACPVWYRVSDVSRACDTGGRARSSRRRSWRREMLNSEALKDHFEANPGDLAALTHDRAELHVRRDLVAAPAARAFLPRSSVVGRGGATVASFKRKKRSDSGGVKRRKGDTSSTRRKDNDPLRDVRRGGGLDSTPKSGRLFEAEEEAAEEPPRVFDERSLCTSQNRRATPHCMEEGAQEGRLPNVGPKRSSTPQDKSRAARAGRGVTSATRRTSRTRIGWRRRRQVRAARTRSLSPSRVGPSSLSP